METISTRKSAIFFNLFDKNVLELEKKNLSEQYAKILSELAAVFNVQVNAYFEIISKNYINNNNNKLTNFYKL